LEWDQRDRGGPCAADGAGIAQAANILFSLEIFSKENKVI